jgi:hypothetical protein
MKNLTHLLFSSLALFFAMIIIQGCEKTGLTAVNPKLVASKTTLRITDIDTLVVLGAGNDSVTWDVQPASAQIIQQKGNKISLTFLEFKTYTVTARINGGVPLSINITNTFFNTVYTTLPITNENITITPTYFKSPTSDSTYFKLSAQTGKTYACGSSVLNATKTQSNNDFVINFKNIEQPDAANCYSPNSRLILDFYFNQNPATPYSFGTTYPLTITVGSTIYTGVITLNPTYMDIVWNYTSGVIMSSKHITL